MKIIIALSLITLCGCARFSTTQTDMSYEQGTPSRQITTKASAYTLFSGKSSLATWKASQTDKTQGASVGGLTQEGGQTNQLSDFAAAMVKAAIEAAK